MALLQESGAYARSRALQSDSLRRHYGGITAERKRPREARAHTTERSEPPTQGGQAGDDESAQAAERSKAAHNRAKRATDPRGAGMGQSRGNKITPAILSGGG